MKKTVEIKAATVELAIQEGLKELNLPLEKVDVEVLSQGGLFQKAVVKLSLQEDLVQLAENFINTTLKHMKLRAKAKAEERDDRILVYIEGEDSAGVIGFRGEVLDAIQYLTLTVINNGEKGKFKKVVVDCECYREKRNQTLAELAKKLAERAYANAKRVKLEPMNPYERRIIHTALQNCDFATTESVGDEPNRHVVISPVGVDIVGTIDTTERERKYKRDDRRQGSFGRRDRRQPRREDNNRRKSYSDYDDLKPSCNEDENVLPEDAFDRTQPLKIKSFGQKKYPFNR